MANLGYVGLGAMGGQMADRLIDKGHKVTGYNRTKAKADWLIKKGMTFGDTPKAVCQAADFVFVMVTNSASLEAVANGPDGLLEFPRGDVLQHVAGGAAPQRLEDVFLGGVHRENNGPGLR